MEELPQNDAPVSLIIAIVVLFPIVFSAFWMGVCFLISRFGWNGFAQDFATTKKPTEGARYFGRSGRFGLLGLGQYRSCLDITLIPEGIHLNVNILFRCGHRPLLIPWSKVESVNEQTFAFVNYLSVVVSNGRQRLNLWMPLESREVIEKYRSE